MPHMEKVCHVFEFSRLTHIQGHQRSSKLQIYHYEWYSCPVNYFAYKSSNALQIGFGGSYYISRCVLGPRGYIGLTVSVRLSKTPISPNSHSSYDLKYG